MIITSPTNEKIKYLMKLKDKRLSKDEDKFIVETLHLVEEAYKKGFLLEIYKLEELDTDINVDTYNVTDIVMKKINTLDTECKIIGVCKKNTQQEIIGKKILLLDKIQDPTNLGTIIRSALAFNITTIVLGEGTCNLYNEKVLRGTQGAIFHLNIISMDLKQAIELIKKQNIIVYATDVETGTELRTINNTNSYAVVMGNEGNGISKDIKELCDEFINIKINNKMESLNVAMATSIILYEMDKE